MTPINRHLPARQPVSRREALCRMGAGFRRLHEIQQLNTPLKTAGAPPEALNHCPPRLHWSISCHLGDHPSVSHGSPRRPGHTVRGAFSCDWRQTEWGTPADAM